jgi:hypothetical protein
MDDNYQVYVNRVAQMTLPNNYKQQLQNIQTSAKFTRGKPGYFPGYSIITPTWEDETDNEEFYRQLESRQQELSRKLDSKFFIPIPPSSFHLTIADLIWEQSYLNALAENAEFDRQLLEEIKVIFQQYQESLAANNSLELDLLGLSIFTRAVAVCLAPTETGYQQIVELRRQIYQNQKIINLGIEQQYHFTAHITLGYFGEISSQKTDDKVEDILTSINEQWLEKQPPIFTIHQLEIRKFDDMMSYYRQPDWPVIKF